MRRAIASEVADLSVIPVKPKTQKLVFSQLLYLTLSVKRTALVMLVMTIFKTQNFKKI